VAQSQQTKAEKAAEASKAEAQKAVDAAEDKGYIGRQVDDEPNSAHSLESGPDAPSVQSQLEQARKGA
jgi:hypothetical protein